MQLMRNISLLLHAIASGSNLRCPTCHFTNGRPVARGQKSANATGDARGQVSQGTPALCCRLLSLPDRPAAAAADDRDSAVHCHCLKCNGLFTMCQVGRRVITRRDFKMERCPRWSITLRCQNSAGHSFRKKKI